MQDLGNKIKFKQDDKIKWRYLTTNNRHFITTADYSPSPAFMEIKNSQSIISLLTLPPELRKQSLNITHMPDQSKLWGITPNGILAETSQSLKYVAKVTPPYTILMEGPSTAYQNNNSIDINIMNFESDETIQYALISVNNSKHKCLQSLSNDVIITLPLKEKHMPSHSR